LRQAALLWLSLLACSASLRAQEFPSTEQLRSQKKNLPPALTQPLTAARALALPSSTAAAPKPIAPVVPSTAKAGPITLLGTQIQPGERKTLDWRGADLFGVGSNTAPVIVINGKQPGPVLCLTGGVHGDELNGIEVVNRIARKTKAAELSGAVIAVPIVNFSGFARGSRYLPDRRDLNRFFPGTRGGSAASRLAFDFFNSVVLACDYLVDFHTGSFERSNLPQVRGDLRIREVLQFTTNFGATPVLHSPGTRGMLRMAATEAGIPAVTFEIGAPIRLEIKEIEAGTLALDVLMQKLGMTERLRVWTERQAVFYDAIWVRAPVGGMLIGQATLGSQVKQGQRLATIRDPISGSETEIPASANGKVIGLALNQMVLPGYAIYHLGTEATEAEAMTSALKPRLMPRGQAELLDEPDEEEGSRLE
jgi:uncharacterized protein